MTKEKYLKELRSKLRFKHSQTTINSVLKDYNEYFQVGLSNGESVDEMINRLGTSQEVVIALESEADSYALPKYISRVFISLILVYFSYFTPFYIDSNIKQITINSLFGVAGAFGFWLLINGSFSFSSIHEIKTMINKKRLSRMVTTNLILYLFLLIVIVGSVFYFTSNSELPPFITKNYLRIYIDLLAHSFVLFIPVIVLTFMEARKKYINLLPFIFVEFGFLQSIRVLFHLYGYTDKMFTGIHLHYLVSSLIPVVVGILAALLTYKITRMYQNKRIVKVI